MRPIAVTFSGKKRVSAVVDGHTITTDQPLDAGGEGVHLDPFTLFLSSLATCAGFYVQSFCAARNIPMTGISMTQDCGFDADHHLTRVSMTLTLPPSFPAKHVPGIQMAAASCKVKKVLASPPSIEIVARYQGEPEQAAAVAG